MKDVDFSRNQVVVRGGKGDKDRVAPLPAIVAADLARHLKTVKQQHDQDLQCGAGWVELPGALARKYPHAGREWAWQWVFPATRCYVERETQPRPGRRPQPGRPNGPVTPTDPASRSRRRATRICISQLSPPQQTGQRSVKWSILGPEEHSQACYPVRSRSVPVATPN